MRHVRKVVYLETSISWFDIPGYKEIIKALFEEMRDRDIHTYPDTLVEAVKSFIANPKLLSAVVTITFSKTKSLDSSAVMKTMDMSAKWFLKLNSNSMSIPADFDWHFFIGGIEMLLQLDHGTATAKVIWLLYQILHTLPIKMRNILLAQILKPENFYGYFFNWSYKVRHSFYYLFYF